MAIENNRPEGQPEFQSASGETQSGTPLARHRAPSADLAPWAARIYATRVAVPDGHTISCSLFNDVPVLRLVFKGDWTADSRDGHADYSRCALFFGPQSKVMPITVTGSFEVVTVALNPGAVAALHGPPVAASMDRIVYYDDIYDEDWASSETLIEWFDPEGSLDRWLGVAENLLRQLLNYTGAQEPNPVVAAFDKAAFEDPNCSISEFAQANSIERRTLERLIKRNFGLTPTQVLRRARVLDIAANLCGVADDAEAEEIALRYYDQSHLIREFSTFFGMTPKQFTAHPRPLLTISLEARQARRLELLGRAEPGGPLPWRR